MSLMHMKTRYRLDSGGAYPSFMEMSPPTSDGEEEEMQKFKITPFTKVGIPAVPFINYVAYMCMGNRRESYPY